MKKKFNMEYPKTRAYIKKNYPDVSDGEITRIFCSVPPNTPEFIVLQVFKAIEKAATKDIDKLKHLTEEEKKKNDSNNFGQTT